MSKANMIEALTAEREALEARLAAAGGDDAPESVKANLTRRIGEVNDQLGEKPAARERRPARKAAEKRPSE
jgi:hypothetical protein